MKKLILITFLTFGLVAAFAQQSDINIVADTITEQPDQLKVRLEHEYKLAQAQINKDIKLETVRQQSISETMAIIGGLGVPAIAIIIGLFIGYKKNLARYKTIENIAISGNEIPKELMEQVLPKRKKRGNLEIGMILLAVGLCLALSASGSNKYFGVVIVLIGVAKIIMAYFNGEIRVKQQPVQEEVAPENKED